MRFRWFALLVTWCCGRNITNLKLKVNVGQLFQGPVGQVSQGSHTKQEATMKGGNQQKAAKRSFISCLDAALERMVKRMDHGGEEAKSNGEVAGMARFIRRQLPRDKQLDAGQLDEVVRKARRWWATYQGQQEQQAARESAIVGGQQEQQAARESAIIGRSQLAQMERRFAEVSSQLAQMERRFAEVSSKLEQMASEVSSKLEQMALRDAKVSSQLATLSSLAMQEATSGGAAAAPACTPPSTRKRPRPSPEPCSESDAAAPACTPPSTHKRPRPSPEPFSESDDVE